MTGANSENPFDHLRRYFDNVRNGWARARDSSMRFCSERVVLTGRSLRTRFFNPLEHTFISPRRSAESSAPSTPAARLQAIGSTCHLVGLLPAPKPNSDRPGFDHLDRLALVCSLTDDARRVLTRRQRSALASDARAPTARIHLGVVPHVCACGLKRLAMPRPRLSQHVRLQAPCASS